MTSASVSLNQPLAKRQRTLPPAAAAPQQPTDAYATSNTIAVDVASAAAPSQQSTDASSNTTIINLVSDDEDDDEEDEADDDCDEAEWALRCEDLVGFWRAYTDGRDISHDLSSFHGPDQSVAADGHFLSVFHHPDTHALMANFWIGKLQGAMVFDYGTGGDDDSPYTFEHRTANCRSGAPNDISSGEMTLHRGHGLFGEIFFTHYTLQFMARHESLTPSLCDTVFWDKHEAARLSGRQTALFLSSMPDQQEQDAHSDHLSENDDDDDDDEEEEEEEGEEEEEEEEGEDGEEDDEDEEKES